MRATAAALAPVAAVAFTACGGSSSRAVERAAAKTLARGSEHVDVKSDITANGQALSMTASGDFENAPALGAMHADTVAAGKHFVLDEVIAGRKVYTRGPILTKSLPPGKRWLVLRLGKQLNGSGLPADFADRTPADMLKLLKGAEQIRKIGEESIAGDRATHYRGTIHVAKQPNPFSVDVWVSRDGLVRRFGIEYRASATAKGTLRLDLSQFGEQVDVRVPKANETVDMTKLGG